MVAAALTLQKIVTRDIGYRVGLLINALDGWSNVDVSSGNGISPGANTLRMIQNAEQVKS
jgi:hypothetical protein